MHRGVFDTSYEKLNQEQRLAVDTTDGPVMVIAGPGTGKTTVLTLRIANILRKTDTPADCILALTFTESGVYAMRKKLAVLIGAAAYRVQISTFHGFANEIIQNNPSSFPKIIGARPASEIDQVRILESLIKTGKWKQVKPLGDLFYYVRPALDAIKNLKKEYYTPETYKRWLKSSDAFQEANNKVRERNLELVKLFTLYEKAMRVKKLYDYEDMLIEAVRVLEEDKDLLADVRENCHYILADEHQDSNGAQNKLLELLAGEDDEPNLFIVGDEKQAIYRFQGASLENFLYFKKRYAGARSIVLTQSYRSHQDILDASHGVAQSLPKHPDVLRPRLLGHVKAETKKEPIIEILSFPNEEAEAGFVARKAKETQTKLSTAILYRNNRDSRIFAESLARESVEFVVRSDEDIFADADIQNLVTLLRAVNDPTSDENLAKHMLSDFSGLDIVDCFKIFNAKHRRNESLISVLKNSSWLAIAGVKDVKSVEAFSERIKKWASLSRNESLTEFLDKVVEESGFRDKLIVSEQGLSKLEKLHAFYEVARSLMLSAHDSRLADMIAHLDSASHFGVRLGASRPEDLPYGTELMTTHRAKGLEFDTVFITSATDDHWGGKARRKLFELPSEALNSAKSGEEEDERRLFYVAMTRARSRVYITYSVVKSDGKPNAPTRFIEDIDKELAVRREEGSLVADRMQPIKRPEGLGLSNLNEKTRIYLKKLFLEQGLTVTALNNYLECPWQYFFQNLVRVPAVPERHQDFGTAMHGAIRVFQNEIRAGKKPVLKRLLALFSLGIRNFGFPPEDLKLWEDRGSTALKSFYVNHIWSPNSQAEFQVDGIEFSFGAEKVNLRGRIDEVNFDANSTASVTDFKTGKPKSRNEILGETKNSSGGMFRQLLFYKLLLERMGKGISVLTGSIEFLEPDVRGNYKKEVFSLEADKLEALEKEISKVAGEIYALDFWGKTCDERDCKWCRLAARIRICD